MPKLSATQITIIAAVILVIADIIALIAAIAAFNEEQQHKEADKCDTENKIIYLKDKLR